MQFSVWVTFTVHEKDREDFVRRVALQARNSLDIEPECHVFDVWINSDEPNQVLLYEIYENSEAFEDHLNSDHYLAFDQDVKQMIIAKTVVKCGTRVVA